MPSKKRKYNARFPAGRIKKIMQTDEEVGKVAQAVPIIISRTLELFVESLLRKAVQVTLARNAKTLSPAHVKHCILAEARFDFLRDLVKNIPDVSAAEEKEMMSADSSPTSSSRYSDSAPRRIAREDSNSSSSSDVKLRPDADTRPPTIAAEAAIDLTKREDSKKDKPVRTANFYQETLTDDTHQSVITINPTYSSPQPSTSSSDQAKPVYLDISKAKERKTSLPRTPATPVTPILNIDFTKNLEKPVIKLLDNAVVGIVSVKNEKKIQRQNSKAKIEKKVEKPPAPVNIDHFNSGDLQIDEDYDT